MALKDLLVYVDPTEDSFLRLRLAVDLAARHESRLTALFVREWSRAQSDRHKSAELGLVSVQGMRDLERSIEASLQAAADRLRTALESLARERGVSAELRCVDGVASAIVPQHARYADLCILGRDQPEGPASVEYTFAEHLLFVTGRPVLFVPAVEGACLRLLQGGVGAASGGLALIMLDRVFRVTAAVLSHRGRPLSF
jgi:nucleotide-binding universal stress UspA family protein